MERNDGNKKSKQMHPTWNFKEYLPTILVAVILLLSVIQTSEILSLKSLATTQAQIVQVAAGSTTPAAAAAPTMVGGC